MKRYEYNYGKNPEGALSTISGYATETTNFGETAFGILNKSTRDEENFTTPEVVSSSTATLFSVGNGTDHDSRKNIIELKADGTVYINGVGQYDGTNPGEATDIADEFQGIHDDITGLNEDVDRIDNTIESIHISEDDANLIYTLLVDGQERGTINIPRDQFLKNVSYNEETNNLEFTFIVRGENNEEVEKQVNVNMTDLEDIYSAGDGLNLENKQFSVKVDADTQPYIEVSSNGVKIIGINEALDKKVSWDESKKVITLPADGSISALRNNGLEGGVLVCQRTYDEGATYVTEVGTTKNNLTLNSIERPKIDFADGTSQNIAYQSEITDISPSLDNYLPLTGGTLTGSLIVNGLVYSNRGFYNDDFQLNGNINGAEIFLQSLVQDSTNTDILAIWNSYNNKIFGFSNTGISMLNGRDNKLFNTAGGTYDISELESKVNNIKITDIDLRIDGISKDDGYYIEATYNKHLASGGDSITYPSLTIPLATGTSNGVISKEDKTKLDSIDTDALATKEEVGSNVYTGANYISKETNLTEAVLQLDEEIKATNDNLALEHTNAEATYAKKTDLSGYLPLTGGNVTGKIFSADSIEMGRRFITGTLQPPRSRISFGGFSNYVDPDDSDTDAVYITGDRLDNWNNWGGVSPGMTIHTTNGITRYYADGVTIPNKTASDLLNAARGTVSIQDIISQVTVPTKVSELTNDSGYQTEAQVAAKVSALVDSAPETLDTLNELAAALGDDPNFATTITNKIAGKQDKLVSGTNIKTINGQTLLGEGNVDLSGYVTTDNLSDYLKVPTLAETGSTDLDGWYQIVGKSDQNNTFVGGLYYDPYASRLKIADMTSSDDYVQIDRDGIDVYGLNGILEINADKIEFTNKSGDRNNRIALDSSNDGYGEIRIHGKYIDSSGVEIDGDLIVGGENLGITHPRYKDDNSANHDNRVWNAHGGITDLDEIYLTKAYGGRIGLSSDCYANIDDFGLKYYYYGKSSTMKWSGITLTDDSKEYTTSDLLNAAGSTTSIDDIKEAIGNTGLTYGGSTANTDNSQLKLLVYEDPNTAYSVNDIYYNAYAGQNHLFIKSELSVEQLYVRDTYTNNSKITIDGSYIGENGESFGIMTITPNGIEFPGEDSRNAYTFYNTIGGITDLQTISDELKRNDQFLPIPSDLPDINNYRDSHLTLNVIANYLDGSTRYTADIPIEYYYSYQDKHIDIGSKNQVSVKLHGDVTVNDKRVVSSSTRADTIWTGTQAEYEAMPTKDTNTLYFITEG